MKITNKILDYIFYSKIFEKQRFDHKLNIRKLDKILSIVNPILDEQGIIKIDDTASTDEFIGKIAMCWNSIGEEIQDNIANAMGGNRRKEKIKAELDGLSLILNIKGEEYGKHN